MPDQTKMSPEQRALVKRFYDHTCFEFMRQGEVRADDPKGFVGLWEFNCKWLEDMQNETEGFIREYSNANMDKLLA